MRQDGFSSVSNVPTPQQVAELLNNKFNLSTKIECNSYDVLLTGNPFFLSGKNLFRLLMVLEEEYGVYCSPENIRKYGFRTIYECSRLIALCRAASTRSIEITT